jgi:putative transposase
MARLPRLAVAGHVHLLLQRGRSGHAVFVTPEDAQSYLLALRIAAEQAGVAVHAYALSAGEAVMLVTPAAVDSLGRMVQSLGRRFVGPYNQRHASSGSPWEGRFRSTVIDPAQHLLACLCFVETLASGLANADPPWSSAAHHLGQRRDPLITEHPGFWRLGNTPFEREAAHRQLLDRGISPAQALMIQTALDKAWALGDAAFVGSLREHTERRTQPLRRGRPAISSRTARS